MKNEKEVLRRLQNIELLLDQRKTKPLNLVEAAKYLSISQSHLYKLTSQRKIPNHKPNGKYLYFYKDELDEWVRASSNAETENMRSEAEKGRGGDTENNEDEEPP